ncbi:hypothetical protein [Algoriphagus ornithinivorans]|uniref:hypothetical protein n=1 Tax=Algoriphagus ornithinivorans TaxID=226506 RepID=UPI0011140915|nr:hypothetical protein [Algoriphagus ornithinivorans]
MRDILYLIEKKSDAGCLMTDVRLSGVEAFSTLKKDLRNTIYEVSLNFNSDFQLKLEKYDYRMSG